MIVLNDYQKEAITKMKNGCVLCADVGTGKSRTSLAYYFTQCGGKLDGSRMTNPINLYIITTAKKRDTMEWESEMAPFLLHSYDISIVVDSWNNIKKYENVTGAFFIFDENKISGGKTWSKTFINISRKNLWIVLTATPGDSWKDYATLFVANGFYKNLTEYKNRHYIYSNNPHIPFPQIVGYQGESLLYHYRSQVLILMRNKDRKVQYHHEYIFADGYDKTLYKRVMRERWHIYKDEPLQSAAQMCLVLRRVVNETQERLDQTLNIFLKHKRVIIFYNFNYELDMLRNLFDSLKPRCECWDETDDLCDKDFRCDTRLCEGISVAEWNGHKHEPIPESKHWVYLVNYSSGAEGWNCISADTIIFFSQTYSYKTLIQAQGRVDRMNSPFREFYYYHIKSHAPIDLAISKALSDKRDFNASDYINKW